MIEQFSEAEIRDYCRGKLESLELWLRRLIDQTLSAAYGPDFFDFEDANGNRLLKRPVVEAVDKRVANEPTRYPRRVDAILLDDAITIVCHPQLFKPHFRESVGAAFPGGAPCLREMLERLVSVRNCLSHANPISLQDAYRVICYTGDVIESIRQYYVRSGMNNEYNVPTIIKVTDSFGHSLYRNQLGVAHDGGIAMNYLDAEECALRPGDTLTVEIEIDPAFDPSEYTIFWTSTRPLGNIPVDRPKVVIPITNQIVSAQWNLQCRITTHKDWHRMDMGADDFLIMYYKVLPPLA